MTFKAKKKRSYLSIINGYRYWTNEQLFVYYLLIYVIEHS